MSIKVSAKIRRPTTEYKITSYTKPATAKKLDVVITEEPLEIRANDPWEDAGTIATLMRTPGHDFELAVGFLASEGVLFSKDQLSTVCYCALVDNEEQRYNVVTVSTRVPIPHSIKRSTVVSSACGICGDTAIEKILKTTTPIRAGSVLVDRKTIFELPAKLRARQKLFSKTGSVHAAGIFSLHGEAQIVREDVGRHNAVDKIIGASLMAGNFPIEDRILVLSGRVALELVQKAAVARIPIIVAVGAPTSLAVDLANRAGITLCGFSSKEAFNCYAIPERIST